MQEFLEIANALPDILPGEIKYLIWKIVAEDWIRDEASEGFKRDMLISGRTIDQIQYHIPYPK